MAEAVADGLILTDARHLYHAFAAVAWLGCIRRGVPRDEALQFVAHKVLDRMQRHPLDERDARIYHQRYLEDLETFRQEQAADQATRASAKPPTRASVRSSATSMSVSPRRASRKRPCRQGRDERDAAFARERAAKVFAPDDDFSAEDDGDVH